jgi:hypothetical protein
MVRIFLLSVFFLAFSLSYSQTVVGGYPIPDLQDEKDTYTRWGWTWDASAEPDHASRPNFNVNDPDIHGDTEGDDLWTSLIMYVRTGEGGYLDRATEWARYFKEDFRACKGGSYSNYCYDLSAFGGCHTWGWGLVAWYEYNNDIAALTEAESIAAVVERLWGPNTTFGCLPSSGCLTYGTRQIGRHLHLITRVAEATGKQRWITLRDKILNMLMGSNHWNSQYGMYFYGEWSTDQSLGSGAYDAGARITSPFQIGVLTEGMAHAWRVTGREDVKNRIIAMADFLDQYGVDPTYEYCGSSFGIIGGNIYHNYARPPVDFWDPVYTTALVNTMLWAYKFTGDIAYYNKGKYFFNRGTKGIYGEPTRRDCGETEVCHFVDTKFSSVSGYFYYDYNKGELQYTYLMFEEPGTAIEALPEKRPSICITASPNPFNTTTSLKVECRISNNECRSAEMKVYNIKGGMVADLSFDIRSARGGAFNIHHSAKWNTGNLPQGIYVLKLKIDNRQVTRRLVLQR